MKKLTLFIMLTFCAGLLFAQEYDESNYRKQNEVQTVMNSISIKRISGFGGPTMSYSTLCGDFAFFMGGGGGIIVNNVFIGGYGEGLSNTVDVKKNADMSDIDFGHGGFWLGYEIAHKAVVHPVISSRIGWGRISGYNRTDNFSFYDNVFVVTPTLSAEVNLTRFFKMNIGAEYRLTLDVNNSGPLTDNDFSSLGVYMNFIFGWF